MLKKLSLTAALVLGVSAPVMAFTHTGEPVDQSMFEGREILPDPWAEQCDLERSLEPIEGKKNLYRHTNNSFPESLPDRAP